MPHLNVKQPQSPLPHLESPMSGQQSNYKTTHAAVAPDAPESYMQHKYLWPNVVTGRSSHHSLTT